VTFDPSGRSSQAVVEGRPFAGTPVGSCVASKFYGVSVSPFDGPPVSVALSLSSPPR
jgi:hypothetical protein